MCVMCVRARVCLSTVSQLEPSEIDSLRIAMEFKTKIFIISIWCISDRLYIKQALTGGFSTQCKYMSILYIYEYVHFCTQLRIYVIYSCTGLHCIGLYAERGCGRI